MYDMNEAIEKVYSDIGKEHSSKKKKNLSEDDYLLMAFMALLKAYFSKSERPKTTMMGA